jgi:hypothetical protein
LLLVAAALSGVASAIFEEQVGAFEWSKTHVGAPSAAAFLKKAVLVGTEKGVIASLAVRNGAINWRHVLGAGALRAAQCRRLVCPCVCVVVCGCACGCVCVVVCVCGCVCVWLCVFCVCVVCVWLCVCVWFLCMIDCVVCV